MEIGPVVLDKNFFFTLCQCIFDILLCLPLEKGVVLHYYSKNETPFNQEYFLLSLVEIGSLVLEKEDENVKNLETD